MNRYKLNRYMVCLFSALFLCINASQANEYGVGFINFPEDPVKLVETGSPATIFSEELIQQYFLPAKEKQLRIDWQITDEKINENRPKVTTTLQIGEKSYVYLGSDVFTGTTDRNGMVNPELVAFAGIYQKDGSDLAVSYQINRQSLADGTYKWSIKITRPFDISTAEGLKRLTTNPFSRAGDAFTALDVIELPIFVRVDYKFADKTQKTIYSSNVNQAYLGDAKKTYQDVLESWFNQYNNIKAHKNLDQVTIDLKKNGKMSNVTINYCVVNLNENTAVGATPLIRYLTWTEFDAPEQLVINGRLQEAKTVATFDGFVFSKQFEYATFHIASIKTQLHLTNPDNVIKKGDLDQLEPQVHPEIQSLNGFAFAKQTSWNVDGTYMGIKLKTHTALCYAWRSLIKSGRGYRTSDDTSTVARLVNETWSPFILPTDKERVQKDKSADQKEE